MKFRVIQVDLVGCDIENIISHLNQFNKSTSEKFLNRLIATAKTLSINPYFQIKYKHIRTIKIKGFPYLVHFIVNEEKRIVIILAIAFAGLQKQDFSGRNV